METTTVKEATEKQLVYIEALRTTRDLSAVEAECYLRETAKPMSRVRASEIITTLLNAPKKPTALTAAPKVEQTSALSYAEVQQHAQDVGEGVFVLPDNGHIVKVKKGKYGVLKAQVWTSFGGTRLTLSGDKVKAHWTYGGFKTLTAVQAEYKMTAQQAKKFVEIWGVCARCGRVLKAAESVEAGIGPVCRKYFGM